MSYHDMFNYLNLGRHYQDTISMSFLICARVNNDEYKGKYVGCYLSDVTNQPLFISDYNNEALDSISLIPTSDTIYIRFRAGNWWNIIPDSHGYKVGIRFRPDKKLGLFLKANGRDDILEDPVERCRFRWIFDYFKLSD